MPARVHCKFNCTNVTFYGNVYKCYFSPFLRTNRAMVEFDKLYFIFNYNCVRDETKNMIDMKYMAGLI